MVKLYSPASLRPGGSTLDNDQREQRIRLWRVPTSKKVDVSFGNDSNNVFVTQRIKSDENTSKLLFISSEGYAGSEASTEFFLDLSQSIDASNVVTSCRRLRQTSFVCGLCSHQSMNFSIYTYGRFQGFPLANTMAIPQYDGVMLNTKEQDISDVGINTWMYIMAEYNIRKHDFP